MYGSRDEAPPERRHQVDAGQSLPLTVRREQLGRLPPLHPATPEGGAQLHEGEVADEPELGPAKALEADDAHRPRSETPLALEAPGGRRRREILQTLEVERPAESNERRGAPGMQSEGAQLGRGEAREVVRARRRVQARRLGRRRPDHSALDLTCETRLDELPAQRAKQRMGHCRDANRAQPAQMHDRAAKQRIAREPAQKCGMVVIEGEHEAQAVDPVRFGGAQHDGAVRPLPGPRMLAGSERRHEDAVAKPTGRVAGASRRQRKRVGAAGPNRRLEHESRNLTTAARRHPG